jgi:Xaa-Pro aminopeptidase
MRLDLSAVQAALAEDRLDGWLLYDFRGINPIAVRLAAVGGIGHMATRRWYYLVPRSGEPRGLVHAIERNNLAHLPGDVRTYTHRDSLAHGLDWLLAGLTRVAMEYSPGCANPYLSRVDAGTVEAVRARGLEIVSSGDLAQRFDGRWDAAAIETHRAASDILYRVKDLAFAEVRRRLADGVPTTEYEIQQRMLEWFAADGLSAEDAPNVSAQENAGNPHYSPTAEDHRPIRRNDVVLIDLWGRLKTPGAVYADITWMGFAGPSVSDEVQNVFRVVAESRDAGIALVQQRVRAGRDVRGWEVDRVTRGVLTGAGYGAQVWHRTGHSLGEDAVHGNSVHMDDYETHDERRLLPGTGFTIEPGLYFPHFGVRSEINIVVLEHDAPVTGPVQDRMLTLA